jgi:hypothetical protein
MPIILTQQTKSPKVDAKLGFGCPPTLHLQHWVSYFFISTLGAKTHVNVNIGLI